MNDSLWDDDDEQERAREREQERDTPALPPLGRRGYSGPRHTPMDRFEARHMRRLYPRVPCSVCGTLCLPEHAPEFTVTRSLGPSGTSSERVRLCRVPTKAAPDGGLLFEGCAETARALLPDGTTLRMGQDPFAGKKAPPRIIG